MAYANPYPTSLPGLDEARLLAIQAMIVASLTDLNSAWNRDALSPITLTSGQVIIGDPNSLPNSLICVVGGGKQDGTDVEISENFISGRSDVVSFRDALHTNIYFYIHPDEMPSGSALTYIANREYAMARFCDHMRKRVFNAQQGANITLASKEFDSVNLVNYDRLVTCMVKQVKKGVANKSFGLTMEVYCAILTHYAEIC